MFSIEHLSDIRAAEIERIVPHLAPGGRLLEVGAGTGQQAIVLQQRGFEVEAIDLAQSNYTDERVYPVIDYDGRTIPFPDASFDVVFSSNVLEHVPDLPRMHAEIGRVLRPGGHAVHVMPTHAWRFWTTVSSFPVGLQHAAEIAGQVARGERPGGRTLRRSVYEMAYFTGFGLLQRRHGERGNVISETWLFHPGWWRRNFRACGFEIVRDLPLGIFHTGNMVIGRAWSPAMRARLAPVLGSACHIFVVRPAGRGHGR